MRRLWLFTCLAGALGCQCSDPDQALKIVVKVDPAQRATCAVLEVSDGSAVRFTEELVRAAGRDELVVGLRQSGLPQTVTLRARGFLSASGCDAPRSFNGEGAEVSATFPDQGVDEVVVALPPPAATHDVDRDGYAAASFGGPDCKDDDASIRPGVAQPCASTTDQDCDGNAGCADSECTQTAFCQRTPDRLAFVTAPLTVDARACSPALTVELQDAQGVVPAPQGLAVALGANPGTGVTFYSDAACTTAVTSVNVPQGATRGSFHFRATQGGTTFTATAGVIGLTPATQLETVTHPAPTQLAFATPPRTAAANACSAALTVELRDGSDTVTRAAGAVLVTITANPATGLQLFSDSGCTAQLSGGSFSVPAGTPSGTFYVRSTRAGTPQLTAAATSLASAQQPFTVTPLAATALNLVGSGQGIATATCSSAVTVQAEDVYGNASPVSAATVVSLASAPPGGGFLFYSDPGCTSAVTQVTIAQSAASEVFYFRGATAGTYTVTASASIGSDTQQEVIGVGPPIKLAIVTPQQNAVVAGTCSGIFTVQSRDVSNNPSNITGSALAVALATNPSTTGLQFFSDAACTSGNTITGTSIPVGQTSASLYFKSNTAGAVTVQVSSSLPTGDSQVETIVPTTATVLRFTNTPLSEAANTCAGPFRVETRDQYGNVSNVFSNTQVNLSSGPLGVTFFTAAGCATSTTQVTIAANSSSRTFYARATVAAPYTLTAASGVGNDTQTFTVTAGTASKLVFQPLAQALTAGACSPAMSVERRDQFDNPVTVGGALAVALSSNATSGFTFHDTGCGAASVTSVTIPANGSSATLYLRGTVAEVVTVTGVGGGLANATHTATVSPDAATKLVFTPAAQTVTAGVCSAQVAVQRQDQFGNPVTAGGALPVNLTSNATGGLTFHAVAGCGSPAIGSVDIAALGSTALLYVRATRVEPVTVTGSGGTLSPATHALTVDPASVSKLVFSPLAQSAAAGACSLVGVERQDQFGNPITTGGALVVTLGSSAASGLTFHSASNCAGGSDITQVTIGASSSTATFYVRATVAEVVTVTGTGGGLSPASHTLTVTPAGADRLVFTPLAQTQTAGVCGAAVTVQRRDQFGNPVTLGGALPVGLSSTAASGLTFHDTAGCGGGSEITQVNIGVGASTATLYIRATVAELVTVTGAGGSLTNATLALTVGAAGADRLVFTPLTQGLTAGVCGAIVSVERRDQFNNPVTTGGALVVGLSSSAAAGFSFHNASSCAGGTSITQVTIGASASSATFYLRGEVAEPVVVTGAGGSLTSATMNVTVSATSASKLVFTVAPASSVQNVCSTVFTVQRRDAFDNPVPVGADTPVNLSHDTTGLDFFDGAGCGSTATTAVTMASGSSTVSFYAQGGTIDPTVVVTASMGGVSDATANFAVTGVASRLMFTSAAQTLPAATCSPQLTVQRQDGSGTPINSGGSLQVNLSSNATANATGGLAFYSDPSCTAAVTFVTIAPGSSAANFYVKAHVAETATLTGQGGSLTNATQPYVTTLGPAAKLRFSNPGPQTIAQLACSALTTVTLEDAGGNPVNAGGGGRVVTFSGTGGTNTTFWTNAACSAAMAGSSTTMTAGTSTVTLYFKAESGASTTLTAASTNPTTITSGTEVETLTPAAPTRLVFTTSPPTAEAGFCQPVTLERQDALNRPTAPASATQVTMTAATPAPAAPLLTTQYFSDPSCGTLLGSPFDIPASASSTVIYVKGRSGSIPAANQTAAQAYTVQATAAGLTSGSIVVTVNPMVRRGTCQFSNGALPVTCTVTPALTDISRTMLFFQVSASNDDAPGDDNVTCHLQLNGVSGNAEVVCDRVTNGVEHPISWQTVSFPYGHTAGGVTVQHLAATCTAQPLDVTVQTSVPRANSFLLFSSRGSGGNGGNNADDFFTAEMTSSTTVQILQPTNGGTTCSVPAAFRIQVVTWANAAVDRGVLAGGATATFTGSHVSAAVARSFLLHTSKMANIGATSNAICRYRLSGFITDATTLDFARGCTGDNIGDISWERVELPTAAAVQQFAMTSAGLTQTVTEVDRTRAFAFLNGNGPGGTANGRTTYSSADRIGSSQANVTFASGTSVQLTRGRSDGVGGWTLYVVEVTP